MQPLVEMVDLSFGYNGALVLEDVNLAFQPGQFATLVGPSGAGKTSLLKLVLQLLRPVSGRVGYRRTPPLRVAYVPQLETVDWNFPVTAEEVVVMGNTRQTGLWPWPSTRERQHARAIMQELEIGELATRHIRDLSGGQQQRVFLARALMASPDLLVVDEPTSGVDIRSAEQIFHLLLHLNRQGMSILLTTHDLNMAAAHVPWVICLNRKIVAQGTPEEVFTDAILSQTYQGEMQVIHHDGLILVHQHPRHHNRQPNQRAARSVESERSLPDQEVPEFSLDGCVPDSTSI
jgi:zinc/manganese transport system ATP-binding protein/zinc transport system ATP-binding protein